MMKRFALNLLRFQKRAPTFRFSSQKENQPKKEQQTKNKQFDNDRDEFNDDEPKFEKDDRGGLGWTIYRMFFWGSTAVLFHQLYLIHNHKSATPVENETMAIPGAIDVAKTIYGAYQSASEYISKPPLDKLLPDVLHPLIQPKTLVLNLTGTLLSTKYEFGKGLVVNKRPGLEQFLRKMSQLYEIVIFSDDDSMLAQTLIPSLGFRQQIIAGLFARECMVWSGSRYIKDLKYLNRDLRKVVVVDLNKQVVPKQKENVIVLSRFEANPNDEELKYLTGLLQNLAKPEVRDVRKILQEMGEDPIAVYQENLKKKVQKINKNKGSKLFGLFGQKN